MKALVASGSLPRNFESIYRINVTLFDMWNLRLIILTFISSRVLNITRHCFNIFLKIIVRH